VSGESHQQDLHPCSHHQHQHQHQQEEEQRKRQRADERTSVCGNEKDRERREGDTHDLCEATSPLLSPPVGTAEGSVWLLKYLIFLHIATTAEI
jgi:hypothetical protein